jgi:hypothetical protein
LFVMIRIAGRTRSALTMSPIDPRNDRPGHPNPLGSPVEETATEARQGSKGTPMLKVLVAGLVLAVLAWGAAEWWGEASDPPAQQTATPPAGDTTPENSNAAPTADPNAPSTPKPPANGSQGSNP